ncbi:excalibur calcium-binding domain-containing protein [Streptomyces sp. NPDC048623]|uniref:excalibur calcium-binding domain-containing protein n=1 Tax=Streptomyces sp. NPDC048623 TaxID=3155761 RepID=UPI00344A7F12
MTQPPPYPHPYAPFSPPPPARRWWQHPAVVVVALVVFPPGGIALAWLSRWARATKIIATVLAGLWFLAPFLGDPPEDDAKPKAVAPVTATPTTAPATAPSAPPSFVGQNLRTAKAAAQAAGFGTVSHDASEADAGQADDGAWKVCFQAPAAQDSAAHPTLDFAVVLTGAPCPARDGDPIPYPKMPKVTGQTFATASETLAPLSLKSVETASAYTDVPLPATADDWTVCLQSPAPAAPVESPTTTAARLHLTAPGTPCPQSPNTRLHPAPKPRPTPKPTPEPTYDNDGSTGGSGSSGGSDGGGSAYYANCAAARDADAAPIHRGEPGYRSGLDRDGDGIACDS